MVQECTWPQAGGEKKIALEIVLFKTGEYLFALITTTNSEEWSEILKITLHAFHSVHLSSMCAACSHTPTRIYLCLYETAQYFL